MLLSLLWLWQLNFVLLAASAFGYNWIKKKEKETSAGLLFLRRTSGWKEEARLRQQGVPVKVITIASWYEALGAVCNALTVNMKSNSSQWSSLLPFVNLSKTPETPIILDSRFPSICCPVAITTTTIISELLLIWFAVFVFSTVYKMFGARR